MELNDQEDPPRRRDALSDTQADLPTPQRLTFARVLSWGGSLSLAGLFITFMLYASQMTPALVPLDRMPAEWGKPLEQFQRDTGIEERISSTHGFRWMKHLNYGEFLIYLPIAALASITVICYVCLIPHYFRQRSYALLIVAVLQIAVLLIAASGLAGGH